MKLIIKKDLYDSTRTFSIDQKHFQFLKYFAHLQIIIQCKYLNLNSMDFATLVFYFKIPEY